MKISTNKSERWSIELAQCTPVLTGKNKNMYLF